MSMGARLELRQSQQLAMTPQMQQAIRLLQLSSVDLSAFVAEAAERNPLLVLDADGREIAAASRQGREAGRDGADGDLGRGVGAAEGASENGRENLYQGAERAPRMRGDGGGVAGGEGPAPDEWIAATATLRDDLAAQIGGGADAPCARRLARLLIDELDPAGYLTADLDRLAERLGARRGLVGEALDLLQACEPTGVGARDLRECLALQLAERGRLDPAMRALLDNLALLAAGRTGELRAACGVDAADLAEMIAEIRALDPKPGESFSGGQAPAITPDATVRRNPSGGWAVELNSDALPKVLVDRTYAAEIDAAAADGATRFLADCQREANWLVRSLDQRAQTMLRVATEIVRRQDGFLSEGVGALRPMTLRAVADALDMHESTVSRVTANKYLATERGVIEMKFFFTQAISGADGADAQSSAAVRHRIKALIGSETIEAVLSDDKIVSRLRGEGVEIARRTVAKYREAMRIPSSSTRRRRLKVGAREP